MGTIPCAIAGIGMSAYGRETGQTSLRLHYDAAVAALDDAGLGFADVDGLFSCAINGSLHGNQLPEYLGINPKFVDSTSVGGGTWDRGSKHGRPLVANPQSRRGK